MERRLEEALGDHHVVENRVEIDTSAPFRSVKEAVMLFGEKVLAGELYTGKINLIQRAISSKREIDHSHFISVATELEETKQCLDKVREESQALAISLASLQEELEKTRRELQQLKERESEKRVLEDVKFIEDATNVKVGMQEVGKVDFQRKRCVTFANPPSVRQVLIAEEPTLQRQTSKKKEVAATKKKGHLIPLIGGLFAKRKGHQDRLPTVGGGY